VFLVRDGERVGRACLCRRVNLSEGGERGRESGRCDSDRMLFLVATLCKRKWPGLSKVLLISQG
jgi:hypothetical protein